MIPNIKLAQLKAKAESTSSYTIACCKCKKPLWKVSDLHQYGTKWGAVKTPFPGVPSYKDYWKGNEALRTDCPHCGETYLQAIQGPNGIVIPKVFVPELE